VQPPAPTRSDTEVRAPSGESGVVLAAWRRRRDTFDVEAQARGGPMKRVACMLCSVLRSYRIARYQRVQSRMERRARDSREHLERLEAGIPDRVMAF
jgi:hypothetical protein